jgi:peptidoglycan/xylan/chitin deacetylase (PgdA/CDA1 family)
MNNRLERGVFILSIDIEPDGRLVHDPMCNEIISLLIQLMERFKIHATWAVIGNTLVGEHESAISKNVVNVIQQILSCKTSQEIGCHTFSHIRVEDSSCTREQFEAELKACRQIFDRFSIRPRSFVFPWNSVGYLDSLRKYGYISYRGPSHDWYVRLPVFPQRLAHWIDHWLLIPSPMSIISYDMGVWNLPASYFYVAGAGWGKMIPIALRVNKVKKGLRRAVRERQLYHLWFHPFNLVNNTQVWLKGLENIFIEVNRYRDLSLLENLTMGEVAIKLEVSAYKKK